MVLLLRPENEQYLAIVHFLQKQAQYFNFVDNDFTVSILSFQQNFSAFFLANLPCSCSQLVELLNFEAVNLLTGQNLPALVNKFSTFAGICLSQSNLGPDQSPPILFPNSFLPLSNISYLPYSYSLHFAVVIGFVLPTKYF